MRNLKHLFITSFILVHGALAADKPKKYVPIVLVHGVISDKYGMEPTEQYIRKYMGDDVYIKNVNVGIGKLTSLVNAYHQGEHLRREIQADPHLKDGFNFVVHSQGGLISRYYLECYNNPQVLTYISWGSPQQGVFGTPGTIDSKFSWLNYLEGWTHLVLYSSFCQKYIGFAGYWHDTMHYKQYLKFCSFLPYLNNEVTHEKNQLYKDNICKLKNMVLVMSTEDDIIEPRISCHFGFYKPGSNADVQELFDTDLYKYDWLGLKTLHESGRLHFKIAHCTHSDFQEDESNFVENTLEFLMADPKKPPLTQPNARLAQAPRIN